MRMTTALGRGMESIKSKIRIVQDFPKPGIPFCDIMSLLEDDQGFRDVVDAMQSRWADHGITKIVGIGARGFPLAGGVCQAMGIGFVPVRKKGKLPPETISCDYTLEYGTDTLEILKHALGDQDRVVIIDDLIATGGTAEAAVKLVRAVGAEVVGVSFIIDLPYLGGMAKLAALGLETHAICEFDENGR